MKFLLNLYIITFIMIIISLLFGSTLTGIGKNCNERDKLLNNNVVGNFLKIGYDQTCNKENSFKNPKIDLKNECINYILTK